MRKADAKSTTSYFLGPTFLDNKMSLSDLWWQYWSFIKKGELWYYLSGILHHCQFFLSGIWNYQLFFLFLNFLELILEHINGPLSGLFSRTKKCWSKHLRGGAFSICRERTYRSKEGHFILFTGEQMVMSFRFFIEQFKTKTIIQSWFIRLSCAHL